MTEYGDAGRDVEQFLREQIDTVPHLEALLLLWNTRPKVWSAEEMGKGLFVPFDAAREILDDLARQGLIVVQGGEFETYHYETEASNPTSGLCLLTGVERWIEV